MFLPAFGGRDAPSKLLEKCIRTRCSPAATPVQPALRSRLIHRRSQRRMASNPVVG
jgi:hypothetical protein